MRALERDVQDAVWQAIEPLLPTPPEHPLGCHRPRVDDRLIFRGILIRLVTGSSWRDIESILDFKVSDTTLRTRRDEWIAAGVFDELCREALAGFDRIIGLDLTEVAIDGSLHKAPYGGEGTGPSPVDRGKLGHKWSVGVDRHGVPIGWALDGANRNDVKLLDPTLDAIDTNGLLVDVDTIHLDRGYDFDSLRRRLIERDLLDVNIQPRRKPGQGRRNKLVLARAALDRRSRQLMAVELRATPTQHRSSNPPPTRRALPRHHHPRHDETHRLARPLPHNLTPIRSSP